MKKSIFFSHLLEISNKSLIPLESVLINARKTGIKGVDIDYDGLLQYGKEILKSKLKISCVYATFNFNNDNYADYALKFLSDAKSYKVKRVMIIPLTENDDGNGLQNAIKGLTYVVTNAKRYKITVTLEPFDLDYCYTNSFNNLVTLLNEVDNLYLTFDTGNFLYDGVSLVDAFNKLNGKIKHVHLKDRVLSCLTNGDKPFTMKDGSVVYSCPVGEGILDIKNFILKLKQIKYKGFVTIEHNCVANQSEYYNKSVKNLTKLLKEKPKKLATKKLFELYKESLPENDAEKLNYFLKEFNNHCLLSKPNKIAMRKDLENAILYYNKIGVSLNEALNRLDNANLGGFYAKPATLWFPLDDTAKIYPFSLDHGSMSLFRLSVYLKKDVVPEILQMALTFTIKRFPSFATTIKKGVFWHYLDTVKKRFTVEKERFAPVHPIAVSGSVSQSFRVVYYNNRISVEFFHVLTDGSGGIAFVKALIAEYLRLLGVTYENDGSILNINDTPKSAELQNEFANVPRSKNNSGLINKPSVQLSGKLTKYPCRFLHFKMDTNSLKQAAKKHNAKITAYILAVMFMAGKYATDEYLGDMSIQLPVNMRNFYPSETLRNFSMYCGIKIPLNKDLVLDELIKEVNAQLEEKTSKEVMSEMLTSTEKLVNSIRFIPLIIKSPVAKLMYGVLGDKAFSNTLSNLGVVEMPKPYLNEIESMDFVLGTSVTNRVSTAMITINNVTTLSITKRTIDPSYEEKLYELLSADGVIIEVEGSDVYEG